MKIIYLANNRLPSEKAYGLAIAKMVSAFSNLRFNNKAVEVELVIPKRRNWLKQDLFQYYGLPQTFRVKKLPCLDLIRFDKYLGRLPIWLEMFSFSFFVFFYVFFKKADIFYTRNKELLFLSFLKKNFYFEPHRPLKRRWLFFLKKTKGVVAISRGLKQFFVEKGILDRKMLIARSAVDLEKFVLQQSQAECRQKLGLNPNKKIVLYSGHLMEENGPQVLAEASQYLPQDVALYFLGGTKRDIQGFKFHVSRFKQDNIFIIGHRSPHEVPYWLKAADVLVMPYLATDRYAAFYMSSLKMFEYMAAKKSIIASCLPSICEVLNQNNALLVEPASPQALVQAIKKLLAEPALAQALAKQALWDVQRYTWQKRAEKILNFCLTRQGNKP